MVDHLIQSKPGEIFLPGVWLTESLSLYKPEAAGQSTLTIWRVMERLIHINHLSYVFICFNVVHLATGAGGLMTAPQNEILQECVFLENHFSVTHPEFF